MMWLKFNNSLPEKPKTQKAQIDALWDIVTNHMLSRLSWQDKKMTFILGLQGLIIALMGILISKS